MNHKHLLNLRIKRAADNEAVIADGYAKGFIKACTDKQVEPERVMELVELLDIHL